MTKSRNIIAPRQRWQPAEEAILRDLYPDIPCADIAALLGRNPSGVYQAADRLGLEKSAYFNASDMSGRVARGQQHPHMVAHRFKPGSTPWNKGSHYVAGGRSAETRFKKGCKMGAAQHNYVPIGTLRISKDGYLERKTTDDPTLVPARRWTAVHRLVWQAAHGPIAPAMRWSTSQANAPPSKAKSPSTAWSASPVPSWHGATTPTATTPRWPNWSSSKGQITRQVNRIQREARP